MSRHGYSEDCDGFDLIRYRGAVASATRGQYGQQLLRDLLTALDAKPSKTLTHSTFGKGEVCALQCLANHRGFAVVDDLICDGVSEYDDDVNHKALERLFGANQKLLREIMFINDDGYWGEDADEARFNRVRKWVAENITPEVSA